MSEGLQQEVDRRAHEGCRRLSVADLADAFLQLGYRIDRGMDCWGTAQIMTGHHAGSSYPCITTGLKEADTGLSAWNCEARRDSKYEQMQRLRLHVYAVTKGAILEV